MDGPSNLSFSDIVFDNHELFDEIPALQSLIVEHLVKTLFNFDKNNEKKSQLTKIGPASELHMDNRSSFISIGID